MSDICAFCDAKGKNYACNNCIIKLEKLNEQYERDYDCIFCGEMCEELYGDSGYSICNGCYLIKDDIELCKNPNNRCYSCNTRVKIHYKNHETNKKMCSSCVKKCNINIKNYKIKTIYDADNNIYRHYCHIKCPFCNYLYCYGDTITRGCYTANTIIELSGDYISFDYIFPIPHQCVKKIKY